MKRILMVMVAAVSLSLAGAARAEGEKAEKPDCSAQKTAHDDAVKASKVKPDLSSCNDKKGKEKTECQKPLKEQAKADAEAAKGKVKEAKMALDCCKNPKKKGCGEAAAAPAPAAPAPAPK
ncbi:MAG TPA: hypothetical protein VN914_01115 [Polyangia bacterium]|nr:hypothetical protein [Polyangia bacterium]